MRQHSTTAATLAHKDPIAEFLVYLEFEKGSSKHTLTNYGYDLAKLAAWAEEQNKPLRELTRQDLRHWIAALSRDEHLGARSVTRAIAALRSFFRFMLLDFYVVRNPAEGLCSPKFGSDVPRFLTIEEVDALFNAIDTKTEEGTRDRAMLEVAYAGALRVSELINLSQNDLFDKRCLRVRGKGRKERAIPIGRSAVKWLTKYRKVRAREGNTESPNMFVHSLALPHLHKRFRGKPVSRQWVNMMINQHAKSAGLQNVSPHTLRHTCATHLHQNGVDVRILQEFLGHASLDTTALYTHITGEHSRRIYNNHHPRAMQKQPKRK
jgi:integrase/recombinase XerD